MEEEENGVVEADERPTIRERVASCGQTSIVFAVIEVVNERTGEVSERDEFVCQVPLPLASVAEHIERFESPHPYVLIIHEAAARLRLRQLMMA